MLSMQSASRFDPDLSRTQYNSKKCPVINSSSITWRPVGLLRASDWYS